MTPTETYVSLMETLRSRLDVIAVLKASAADNFASAESAAFHGRKIVEGVAFACLVAIENGLQTVPRDAKGQWSAEDIFKSLKKKGLDVLPSSSRLRSATADEKHGDNVTAVVEGIPDRRLSHDELISIYQRLHAWAHEINPYTRVTHEAFYSKRSAALWDDLNKLELFMQRHFISIRGKGYFCTLRDTQDGRTKVLPLTKDAAQPALAADAPQAARR